MKLFSKLTNKNNNQITVDKGYSPQKITLKQGEAGKLTFTRAKGASSCLEELYFPELGIQEKLPEGQAVEVNINTDQPGTYEWHCGMNMFTGKVIIK